MTLHVWNNDQCAAYNGQGTEWNSGLAFDGVDKTYGAYWDLPFLTDDTGCINFIPHRGDEKPLPLDAKVQIADAAKAGFRAFTFKGDSNIYYEPLATAPVNLKGAAAHWVDGQTLLMPAGAKSVALYQSSTGNLAFDGKTVSGFDQKIDAVSSQNRSWVSRFPHLSSLRSWELPLQGDNAKQLLKGQLYAVAKDEDGNILQATQVQAAGVLDTLYVENGTAADSNITYGAYPVSGSTQFRLWSPTAQSVSLVHYGANKNRIETLPMQFETDSGSWFLDTDRLGHGDFYRYSVTIYHSAVDEVRTYEVTDPYSLSLAMNSTYSQVVDLDSPDLKPAGWDALTSLIVRKTRLKSSSMNLMCVICLPTTNQ